MNRHGVGWFRLSLPSDKFWGPRPPFSGHGVEVTSEPSKLQSPVRSRLPAFINVAMTDEQCCKRSLIGSLWESAKRVVKDPIPVPDNIQEERMKICLACSKFKNGRCKECGCYMRIKTQFAEMECPIGKWDKHKNS